MAIRKSSQSLVAFTVAKTLLITAVVLRAEPNVRVIAVAVASVIVIAATTMMSSSSTSKEVNAYLTEVTFALTSNPAARQEVRVNLSDVHIHS